MTKDPIGFTEQNVVEFDKTIRSVQPPDTQMAFRDLFALGCYLCLTGKQAAGLKVCMTSLDAFGFRQNELTKIREGLKSGHALFLARTFKPHAEVERLLEELGSAAQN